MRNWVLILTCLTFPAFAADGVITVKSAHGAKDTMDRLRYNDPAYLAVRHGVAQCPAVEGLKKALAAFAQQAISK